MFRVGIGYDVHKLVEGRELILGGVKVLDNLGLMGHSDGDVLTHAVCDALLGAAGERELGYFFPEDDPKYHNISSLLLLKEVKSKFIDKFFCICYIDAVIVASRPKLTHHLPAMQKNLASVLSIDRNLMNLKLKSANNVGDIGKGEGICAHAICLLSKEDSKCMTNPSLSKVQNSIT